VRFLLLLQDCDLLAFLSKGFYCEKGLGFVLPLLGFVFLPVALLLGGKKVPTFLGIRILYLIYELNLCLSIPN
jgi:hypothetical protein